jgi:hypothetical protein
MRIDESFRQMPSYTFSRHARTHEWNSGGVAREGSGPTGLGEVMPNKLEFAPDYWRKRAAETRGLAELIEDHFTAEALLDIARRYDELALRAEQRSPAH